MTFLFLIQMIECRRLQLGGNKRNMASDISSLSARQIKILKILLKKKCQKKYGRFAQGQC